jgi:hypothetical protein
VLRREIDTMPSDCEPLSVKVIEFGAAPPWTPFSVSRQR